MFFPVQWGWRTFHQEQVNWQPQHCWF